MPQAILYHTIIRCDLLAAQARLRCARRNAHIAQRQTVQAVLFGDAVSKKPEKIKAKIDPLVDRLNELGKKDANVAIYSVDYDELNKLISKYKLNMSAIESVLKINKLNGEKFIILNKIKKLIIKNCSNIIDSDTE